MNYLHLLAAVILGKLALDWLQGAREPVRISQGNLLKDGVNYRMRGLMNAEGGAWTLGTDVENQLAAGRPYQGGSYLRYQ